VEWKQQGLTEARILEHHPIEPRRIWTLPWTYYANHRDEIDQAIKASEDA